MPDTLTTIGESLVQHGKDSDRVYLMKLCSSDADTIVETLEQLAQANHYTKIFCKVPASAVTPFELSGYHKEAEISGFYQGREAVAFMSRFLDIERSQLGPEQQQTIQKVLAIVRDKANSAKPQTSSPYQLRALTEADCSALAELYQAVFPSYPFPITDPAYLLETMASHVFYYGAFDGDNLVAASSAETDLAGANAEMTDFAALPACRGKGTALALLQLMQNDLGDKGVQTFYTIARAVSVGMNVTFSRAGYEFAGTLVNNTQISGSIESMNVWYYQASG